VKVLILLLPLSSSLVVTGLNMLLELFSKLCFEVLYLIKSEVNMLERKLPLERRAVISSIRDL